MAAAWRCALVKSLEANKQVPYHKYMQLGTVRPDGRPSVRTVVFRGFHQDTDQITFATDTRTYKVEHVQKEPWAEICWYFTESREQFRLGGNLQIIGEDHPDEKLQKAFSSDEWAQARQETWDRMSLNGRAWFAWPSSGRPREPDGAAFEKLVPDKGEPAVPSFALVIMDVDTVDYVLLPNLRMGYTSTLEAEGRRKWSEQELNP